ncbi:rCG41450 [Rattus norvegicus]|uniref:RCG41450 n=1 Tax=Rattus norvegicus TaxID=10116 RepID=A6IHC2_RAT|nr:rCG41450 [Rattus norvegicus]
MRVEKAMVARLREPATGLSRGKPLSRHGHSPASSSSGIIRHPSKKITFWWDESVLGWNSLRSRV